MLNDSNDNKTGLLSFKALNYVLFFVVSGRPDEAVDLLYGENIQSLRTKELLTLPKEAKVVFA